MNKKYVLDFGSWLAENKSVSGFRLNEAEESEVTLTGNADALYPYFLYKTEMFKTPESAEKMFGTLKLRDMEKVKFGGKILDSYLRMYVGGTKEDISLESNKNAPENEKGYFIVSKKFADSGIPYIGFIEEGQDDIIKNVDVVINHNLVKDKSFVNPPKGKGINKQYLSLEKFAQTLWTILSDYKSSFDSEALKDWKGYDWNKIRKEPFAIKSYQMTPEKYYDLSTSDLTSLGVYKEGAELPKGIIAAEKDPSGPSAQRMLPTPELLASVPVLKTAAENFAKKGEQKSK